MPMTHYVILSIVLLGTATAMATRPLIVEDADPADHGTLELEVSAELLRENGIRNIATPVTITYGLTENLEIALDLGYQWERRRAAGQTERVDGLLDTVFSAKWKFHEQDGSRPAMALMPEIKAPTASEGRGLGDGHWDAGLLFIATWANDRTAFDLNAGYTFIDLFNRPVREGELFLGGAIRREIDRRLWLVAELFAAAPAAHVRQAIGGTSVGFTYDLSDRAVFDAGIGTGIGAGSPDLTATVGVTWFID